MTEGDSRRDTATVIRKYANRRLYNTATGRFITLDGLHDMVVAGEDFAVVDAQTGQDITASVLTQIIAEQESRGESLLPLDVLRQVISLYHQGLGGPLSTYLNQSLAGFSRNMEQMQRLNEIGRRNLEILQDSFTSAPGGSRSASSSSGQTDAGGMQDAAEKPEGGPEDPETLSAEVRALRDQLEIMQRRLDEISDRGSDSSDHRPGTGQHGSE